MPVSVESLDALRPLVAGGPIAHLATIDPDGSPQVSAIWIAFDGDDLVSGHMSRYRKVRNVERDPRVVLSFDAPRTPGEFMAAHAVVSADATVEEGGAWELLDDLARVYIGPDATFPAPRSDGGFVLRYRITKVGGIGPWAPSH